MEKYSVTYSQSVVRWTHQHRHTSEVTKFFAATKKMSDGNFGDTRQIVGNLYEKRVHTRSGLRIYYYLKLSHSIHVLLAGTKNTQKRDIIQAKKMWTQETGRTK